MIEKILLLLVGAVLAFLGTWYWTIRSGKTKTSEALLKANLDLSNRLVEMEAQVRIMSQSVGPINAAMQALLVRQLTHVHTPVTDRLLKKLGPPNTLTTEEETILFAAIRERITDMGEEISDEERDAAKIFPIIVKMAKSEAKSFPKAGDT